MGICDAYKTTPKAECQTVVTRAEFETLVKDLDPNMVPQTRKQWVVKDEIRRTLQGAHMRDEQQQLQDFGKPGQAGRAPLGMRGGVSRRGNGPGAEIVIPTSKSVPLPATPPPQ